MKTHTDIPREIAPGVFCLGPQGAMQTNVYFVRSGLAWALVDAGWAKDGPRIKQAAESLFGAQSRPTAIMLTHCHPDHSGSALQLARIWECLVYVHARELPIAAGDFSAITRYAGPLDTWLVLPLLRLMGRRRREAMILESSLKDAARPLAPTDRGLPGLQGWEYVPTPGHTPGHISFFRASDRVLITGDAVVTLKLNSVLDVLLHRQGLSGPPWYTTWSWPAARKSVATLAKLEPNVLAPGHGAPMTGVDTAHKLRVYENLWH